MIVVLRFDVDCTSSSATWKIGCRPSNNMASHKRSRFTSGFTFDAPFEQASYMESAHYRPLDFTVGLSALGVLALGIVPGAVIALVQGATQLMMSGA